jgi:Na+/H+ antiporter NhaD/arsenite permease-like protein
MGALLSVCLVWLASAIIEYRTRKRNEKSKPTQHFKTYNIKDTFTRIEWETPLFFFGILLAVEALREEHILQALGGTIDSFLDAVVYKQPIITLIVGFISAIMDNVALVATVKAMYPMQLTGYASNSPFWFFLSFCAGTGGSMLVVGSAAGVAVRNKLEHEFDATNLNLDSWYRSKISIWAFCNYMTGFLIYFFTTYFFH